MRKLNNLYILGGLLLAMTASCKKDHNTGSSGGGTTITTDPNAPIPLSSPTNPSTSVTQGFFLDNNWQAA